MKNKLIIAILLILPIQLLADPVEEGKAIFLSRCAACHNVNKQMTGPALAGVDERRTLDWIVAFVSSSQSLIKKGDKDAIALFEKFNKVPMPDHSDLTAEKIRSIVEYIKSEAKPALEETPINKPRVQDAGFMPLSLEKNWLFFAIYLGAVFMLVGALTYAVKVKSMGQKN